MPIVAVCPACQSKVRAPDAAAGKRAKCPKCGAAVAIPSALPEWVSQVQLTPTPTPTPAPTTPKVKVVSKSGRSWFGDPVRAGGVVIVVMLVGILALALTFSFISPHPKSEAPPAAPPPAATVVAPTVTKSVTPLPQPSAPLTPQVPHFKASDIFKHFKEQWGRMVELDGEAHAGLSDDPDAPILQFIFPLPPGSSPPAAYVVCELRPDQVERVHALFVRGTPRHVVVRGVLINFYIEGNAMYLEDVELVSSP